MTFSTLHLGTNKMDVAPGAIWAHLQRVTRDASEPLIITVPHGLWQEVFDSGQALPPTQTRAAFVRTRIEEFGSFAVEGILKQLRLGSEPSAYSWVLASVDEVPETEDGVVLNCRAIPLEPGRL